MQRAKERNIKLTIAFDGTAYHGWQIQQGQDTIQGIVREAIRTVTGETVNLIGSGRTDAGVHARRLIANCALHSPIPASNLMRALNGALPPDIRILAACCVAPDFHARRNAKSKIYRYQIYRGKIMPPHLAREHFHYPHPLETEMMQRAAAVYAGQHDFASFAAKSGLKPEKNSVRNILRSELRCTTRRIVFTVEGNGFLQHMVRNMVGTLIDVGRGRIPLDAFPGLFAARDRNQAGFTAPAHGLILVRVRY